VFLNGSSRLLDRQTHESDTPIRTQVDFAIRRDEVLADNLLLRTQLRKRYPHLRLLEMRCQQIKNYLPDFVDRFTGGWNGAQLDR
jgi:hypothetical protein